MESLVNEPILNALYTSVKDQVYARPPKLQIFVTHYQTPIDLHKCLTSLFTQTTTVPFHVYVVDDASDQEAVADCLNQWASKEPLRLTIHRNQERRGKGQNLLNLLDTHSFGNEDVIGIVDGDDWLNTTSVLDRVLQEYQTTGCWVTYGTYRCSSGTVGACTNPLTAAHFQGEASGRGFRDAPWVFSHFFTAKAFLWKALPKDLFVFEGTLEPFAPADQVCNLAIAELAGCGNIRQIPDILYVYNNESALNDCKVRPVLQESFDQKNRRRPAFAPMKRPLLETLTIMPCRGRFPLLNATLQRFKEEETSECRQILLVEHSEEPSYKDYALDQGVAWLSVPLTSTSVPPLSQFNRGLCFDLGVLYGVPASYYLCHDNDLLVPENFWSKLKANLDRKPYQVLQTYSDRFVWQTNPQISQRLIDDPSWFRNGFTVETDCSQNGVGAKGGSLTISREAYLAVGGHDPHLFYGYAAEDAFFWAKVQLLYEIGYGDAPRIPLTHLWHPNAANLNPQKHPMDLLFYMFQAVPESHRRRYLALKAAAFQQVYSRRR